VYTQEFKIDAATLAEKQALGSGGGFHGTMRWVVFTLLFLL
jgi:hypothetical protein